MGIRISSIYKTTVIEGTGKLDVGEYELQLFDSRYMIKEDQSPKRWSGSWLKPSCIPITIILVLIVLVVLLPLLESRNDNQLLGQRPLLDHGYHSVFKNCSSPCVLSLVESIPDTMSHSSEPLPHWSTFDSWHHLIGQARNSIDVASFYWSLRRTPNVVKSSNENDNNNYNWRGETLFESLLLAGTERGVKIRVVKGDPPQRKSGTILATNDADILQSEKDVEQFSKAGAGEVRTVSSNVLQQLGILGTTMLIVDETDFYLGSADLHWRSITQSKELGVMVSNCSCLAYDLGKIFQVYWAFGVPSPTLEGVHPTKEATGPGVTSPVVMAPDNNRTKRDNLNQNNNNKQLLSEEDGSPQGRHPRSILDRHNYDLNGDHRWMSSRGGGVGGGGGSRGRVYDDDDDVDGASRIGGKGPPKWFDPILSTTIGQTEPVQLLFNGTDSGAFFASSPDNWNPSGRSENLQTILSLIRESETFLDIATPEYLPMAQKDNSSNAIYWPEVDSALRRAVVERDLKIRILTGLPKEGAAGVNDAAKLTVGFLKSLAAIGGNNRLSVKVFLVPRDVSGGGAGGGGVDDAWSYFGSQFIVSESKIYIGTSKWTGNGLLMDASVGFVIDQSRPRNGTAEEDEETEAEPIRKQLSAIFDRDWNSQYSKNIDYFNST